MCFETNLCVTLYGHVVEEPCCICVNRLWNPCLMYGHVVLFVLYHPCFVGGTLDFV